MIRDLFVAIRDLFVTNRDIKIRDSRQKTRIVFFFFVRNSPYVLSHLRKREGATGGLLYAYNEITREHTKINSIPTMFDG